MAFNTNTLAGLSNPNQNVLSGVKKWNKKDKKWDTTNRSKETADAMHANFSWQDFQNLQPDEMTAKYSYNGTGIGGGFGPVPQQTGPTRQDWIDQNKHADLYRTDPAYKRKWHREHGQGSTLGQAFQLGTGAMIGAGMAGLLTPAAASTTAAGAVNAAAPTAMTAGGTSGMAGLSAPTAAGGGLTALSGSQMMSPASMAPITATGGNMIDPFWGNVLNAGSGLLSGYLSHDATGNAMDELSRQYDQTREDNAPWRKAGKKALNKLSNFNIEDDPIYQNQLAESEKAISRAMAARGYNDSGNVLYELGNNAVTQAGKYQGDVWGRQAQLAGLGANANNTNAMAGSNTAGGLANLQIQRGQGYNNAIQGTLNNYLLDQYVRGY